jgi:hypothetical protein
MVDVIEVAGNVCLDQVVVFPQLRLDGEFVHGVQYSHTVTIPITAVGEILLKDGFQDAFDCHLQQLIWCGRNRQGTPRAMPGSVAVSVLQRRYIL